MEARLHNCPGNTAWRALAYRPVRDWTASASAMRGVLLWVLFFASPGVMAIERIVSLNLCTDQLLLLLVERDKVAMLSELAHNPDFSAMAELAHGIPAFNGSVETVIRLQPELVIAGRYAAASAVQLLRRLGFRVVLFEMPESVAGVRSFIRQMADTVENRAKGETLIAQMDLRLSELTRPAPKSPIRVLLYLPNGLTVGRDTLKHELMGYAGLVNLAALDGISGYGQMDLEHVIRTKPDLILLDSAELKAPSIARALLDHPVIRHQGIAIASIPTRSWLCPGPEISTALQALVNASALASATLRSSQ